MLEWLGRQAELVVPIAGEDYPGREALRFRSDVLCNAMRAWASSQEKVWRVYVYVVLEACRKEDAQVVHPTVCSG